MYKPIPGVHVVGIGHKARNGKDSTAAVFQDFFGSMARRYSFADALRAICRVNYGMTVKDAPLLQVVGTEVYRRGETVNWAFIEPSDGEPNSRRVDDVVEVAGRVSVRSLSSGKGAPDPDVWTRTLYWTIAEQAPLVAIISDVRFPNEAEMVKEMGGTLIQCIRRTQSGRQYVDPSRSATHPSETALDGYKGWDYIIDTDRVSTLEYLAVNICEEIAGRIGYGDRI
jgi:hypothetical protein